MAEIRIDWHQVQADALLNAVAVDVLTRAGDEVAAAATEMARVRSGRMKASVYSEVGYDQHGWPGPTAEVHAMWYGRFLDPKARQLHRLYPFLPSALEVINGRVYR